LQQSQVLIIQGGTGCGKSTQIPQFVLEFFEEQQQQQTAGKKNPQFCNILCSQPRRLSAIGIILLLLLSPSISLALLLVKEGLTHSLFSFVYFVIDL
jgi:hypothetical protein